MRTLRSAVRQSILFFLTMTMAMTLPLLALAEGLTPNPAITPLPVGDALQSFIGLIGGVKGASVLGLALLIVQGVLYAFRGLFDKIHGGWKYFVVTTLSLGVVVLGQMVAGAPLFAALLNGSTLAAVQVWINQGFKQFAKKE